MKAGVPVEYFRDTYLEINLDHVYHNVTNLIHNFALNTTMMAVIKADAYGHGAIMVAKTLIEAGIRHFGVATLDEALELRRAKINCPILVFGGIRIGDLIVVQKHHLTLCIHSEEWLNRALDSYIGPSIDVHLKYDTGMGRVGITDEVTFIELFEKIKKCKQFKIKGVLSHLATSEEMDDTYYQLQISRFESLLEKLDLKGLHVHIANSAGSLKPIPKHVNMVRIGLFINGIRPASHIDLPFVLKPSLSLYSRLVQIKSVPPGVRLSYNGIYETQKNEIIGTIPIGYADGYDRRLLNGRVYIEGYYCDIVGRICMDYCLVRLPLAFKEGTRVELIGEHVTLDEYANKINTNNYQATCQFSDRLPRIYYRNQKIVKIVNRRLMTKIGRIY